MYTLPIKSFLKTILIMLSLLLYFQTSIYAANISLMWDANTEPDLDHYVVYWGTSTENYTDNSENHGEFIGRNDTTYIATDLDTAQHTYYFAAKAFDTKGYESDYSDEANTVDGPFASRSLKLCKIANELKIKQKTIKARKLSNVTLKWIRTKHDLDHYIVYWGTFSGPPYKYHSPNIGRNMRTYTVTGLDLSKEWFFSTKAFDTKGYENNYSREVSTKAPKIMSIPIATLITNTTTIIKWTTDEPSTSIVGYKNGYSRGCLIITHNIYTTNHSVTLRNLKPNTSYIFFVGSTNKNKAGPNINNIGNNPSNIYTFETKKTLTRSEKMPAEEAYNSRRPKSPSWGKVTPNPNTRLGKPIYTLIIPKQNYLELGHL